MRILHNAAIPSFRHLAHEPESPWAVRAFGELVPPATLQEARAGRDALAALLSRERAASADFLLALADFDRRRGWERLGHASLFAFLSRELGLSNGAAYLRSSAARLLPRFPAVEAALREGRLCLSAVGELARVLTAANEAAVLPRYFGCSAREAREVTAALLPRADPPRREVVTRVAGAPSKRTEALAAKAPPSDAPLLSTGGSSQGVAPADEHVVAAPARAPEPQLRAHEVEPTQPARVPRAAAIPLTADLRRLHLTVTAGFLEKVGTARTGLSHAMPGATIEQVLEAAIEALLEKQAGRKGLGKRALERSAETNLSTPRPLAARDGERARTSEPGGSAQEAASRPPEALPRLDLSRPERPHVPASLERAVRLRDGDRCQFPLDAGGVCGSTWQVELDHVRPFALGGETSLANLRCLCRRHNQAAARAALGSAAVEIRRRVLAAGSLGGRLRGAAPATTNRESVVRVQATGPGMADG